MVPANTQPLTLETFLQLLETKPASEYIDGQVIQKPMPQGKHSRLQGELVSAINSIAQPRKIAYAFPELRCTFDGSSTVPDIAVFTWTRIPRNGGGEIANTFPLAPDWTIEILSPGQRQAKVTKNILRCLKSGSQMGWLIDPEDKAVFIYRPQQEIEVAEVLDEPDAHLPVPAFLSEFLMTPKQLFSLLRFD